MAVVTAVVPEPRDSGKKVVLAGLLAYWRSRVGRDNLHVVLVANEPPGVDLGAVVHPVGRPTSAEQFRSVLLRSGTGRHTLQESALFSPRIRDQVAATLEEVGADLEIFDTVRMGQFAELIPRRPGVRRVAYLDDLFSVRYDRMLQLMREHPATDFDPLGDFRTHLPSWAVGGVERRWVRRALLAWERRAVARREDEMARAFDSVLLISPEEVRHLAVRVPGARVEELPPSVAARRYERCPDPTRPVFVLMGLLTLAHNADAARVFLESCMSEVRRRLPEARVHIVGRGAQASLEEAARAYGGAVSVDGYVADLDALLSRATALVMPLRFGSGIKIKVIEAFAHGVPVISSPVGAEGVRTGPAYGVLVASDPQAVADAMVELADPERNDALSAAARRHYEEHYSVEACARQYARAFGV